MSSILDRASFIWGGAPDYKAGYSWALKPRTGDGIVPMTRASDKWVINSAGLLVKKEADELANEWDADGNYKGVSIEPSAVNIGFPSDGTGMFGSTASASFSAIDVPTDPVQSVDCLWTAGASVNRYEKTITGGTYSNGQVLTWSWYQKRINYDNGIEVISPSGLINATIVGNPVKIEDLADGWERWSTRLAITTGSSNTILRLYVKADSVGVSDGFAVWGNQIETGSVATSYIPTTTASATRQADVNVKTNVAHLIGQTQGTIVVECNLRDLGTSYAEANRYLFAVSDNSANNRVHLSHRTSDAVMRFIIVAGGVVQVAQSASAVYGKIRLVLVYSSDRNELWINGTKVINLSDSITIPQTHTMFFGKQETSTSSLFLNDHLPLVALFKEALTDEEIASIPRIT